ncbi:MAG: hypothetical protein ABI333_06120 [bacterium]
MMSSGTGRLLSATMTVLLGATAVGACQKQDKRKPFTCERFQKRAERCEKYVLEVMKQRIRAEAKTGQRTEEQASLQFKMVKHRLLRNIRGGSPRENCEKLARGGGREVRRRFSTMKYCYLRDSCEAFAKCVLRIW